MRTNSAAFLFLFSLVLTAPPAATETVVDPLATNSIAGLLAEVQVIRDAYGIAHIRAENTHDLYFVQGFVHAQDRLFQMDLTRRQGSGTLAEVLGVPTLASDVELRTIGLRRAAERSMAAAAPDFLAEVEAYADGVNAFVAAYGLPMEYGLLELTTFEPWTALDSLVVAKILAFGLSFDLEDIDRTEALLTYQGAGGLLGFDGTALFFEDLFRSAPFDPASTIPDATGEAPRWAGSPAARLGRANVAGVLDTSVMGLIQAYRARIEGVPILRNAMNTSERVTGSNEWAVAPSKTATNRPLMANDPHLALDIPTTFYPCHLAIPGEPLDVMGMGFPGAPYVVLGQNRKIAWGATWHPLDVTDVYSETLVPLATSPSGLATMYMGNPEPVIPVPEVFRYNQLDGTPDNLATAPPGGMVGNVFIPPATMVVPRRNNGPIVALDMAAGTALTVQYTGFSASQEFRTFRAWNRARNLREFQDGMKWFDVGSQNWAYADIYGNIAYFTSAEMPIREDLQAGAPVGLPPYFIRSGTGGNEWMAQVNSYPGQAVAYEVLSQEELPHVINPARGFFVNANNDPDGTALDNDPLNQLRVGGGIYYLTPGHDFGTRAGRITQALTERLAAGPVTRTDMAEIQADVTMLDAQVLTPFIQQAFQNASAAGAPPELGTLAADPRVAEAVSRLGAWDFTAPTGIPEGYDASDVDGVPGAPTQAEMDASVAASIFSVWRGQALAGTIDAVMGAMGIPAPGTQQAMTALRNLLDSFDTMQGMGASGLDFFPYPALIDPADRRDAVLLQALTNALDLLAGPDFDCAFGGSTDQDDYRWGYLHRIVFDHPLGEPFSIPPAGGTFPPPLPGLSGIPVDGGFGVPDASSHSARANSCNEFMFGSGPVRRYVGEPDPDWGFIHGQSTLPGGTSGTVGSPHYDDLLRLWLTNDTYPLTQSWGDVLDISEMRMVFTPAD